jgi:hypothetical protein
MLLAYHDMYNHVTVHKKEQHDRLVSLTKNTPAARGLEELFSAILKKFLQPIHAPRVYGT